VIRDLIWRGVARIVTIPAVTDWLIERAQRTPYTNITSRDDTDIYMVRLWLFNPYPNDGDKAGWEKWGRSWRRHLPSARIHHIRRPDDDGACHDHPWNARTTVLRNYYEEERPVRLVPKGVTWSPVWTSDGTLRAGFRRERGYTGRLMFGEYHRIREVGPGGVWTLFVTWKKQGTWGFLVDGVKVPWRKYLGLEGQ
jgi:hypothetical protein